MKVWSLGVLVFLAGIVAHAAAEPREIEIIVEHGYSPRSIDIAPGQAVRLRVIRKEYTPCTKDIVFPSLGITRELPVGQPVLIDIPPQSAGEVPFRCGMNMVKGALVVKGELMTGGLPVLVADSRDELLGFVTKRVGDRALAEDILHDALKRALEHAGELRDDASVRGWFYQILRNAITDTHRQQSRAVRATERLAGEEATAVDDAELDRSVCRCVARLKDTLKPEYAAAITRIELDDVAVKDYAAEIGISASAAAVRVFRARDALRKQLAVACGACAEHGCFDCTCGKA